MVKCYSFWDTTGGADQWTGCETCVRWAHLKCVHLHGVKADNNKLINWSRDMCYIGLKSVEYDMSEMIDWLIDF